MKERKKKKNQNREEE